MSIESNKNKPVCPEGRISCSIKQREGRDILDISQYIPYFLNSVNNALSRSASLLYLDRYGVGIVEWRVIAMLAIEPHIPANRICEVISLDKAATSRALKVLNTKGFVGFTAPPTDERRKVWYLNEKGYDLHDQILQMAIEREEKLIDGVDPDDLEAFIRVMQIMRKNVDSL